MKNIFRWFGEDFNTPLPLWKRIGVRGKNFSKKCKIKKGNKNSQAFTLIELLLVLTLLIIILSLAVLTLRQHAENARINKAALEIEQVLQSAITYSAQNGKWPDNNFSLTCEPDSQSDFVKNYLSNQQFQSSLGYNYCWQKEGKNNQLFWVALQVPDSNQNFALRLAAHLPNALITLDPSENNNGKNAQCEADKPCFVRAEIAANTVTENAQSFVISAGNCAHGFEENDVPNRENCQYTGPLDQTETFAIHFPSCPQNYDRQIIVSPNFTTMPELGKGNRNFLQGYSFTRYKATSSQCTTENNQDICKINLQVQVCANDPCDSIDVMQAGGNSATATVGASYVVICKLNVKPKQSKALF